MGLLLSGEGSGLALDAPITRKKALGLGLHALRDCAKRVSPYMQAEGDFYPYWMAARILVKNSRMCRTGVLQDPVTPLRLW
jgi:hypothetical protein